MRKLLRPICWLFGHDWQNEHMYPTHGYFDLPNEGSWCSRCGEEA